MPCDRRNANLQFPLFYPELHFPSTNLVDPTPPLAPLSSPDEDSKVSGWPGSEAGG